MDVLILAGARSSPELRAASGAEFRCEAEVAGTTMLDTAVAASRHVGPLVVVGPRAPEGASLVAPGASMVASLSAGLGAVSSDELTVVTADLPFLRPEHVSRFLAARPSEAHIAYPIVPVACCETEFPGLSRTGVRLREGRFTGGNVFYARREALQRGLAWLESAYDARKSPVRLAGMLGAAAVGRLAVARFWPQVLPLAWVEGLASARLGIPVRAVVLQDAAIATDVDSPAHLAAARAAAD